MARTRKRIENWPEKRQKIAQKTSKLERELQLKQKQLSMIFKQCEKVRTEVNDKRLSKIRHATTLRRKKQELKTARRGIEKGMLQRQHVWAGIAESQTRTAKAREDVISEKASFLAKFKSGMSEIERIHQQVEELRKKCLQHKRKLPERDLSHEESEKQSLAFRRSMALRSQRHKVQSLSRIFDSIKEATRITDVDVMASMFLESERQQFSCLRQINDLASEKDKLEVKNAELRSAIGKAKTDSRMMDGDGTFGALELRIKQKVADAEECSARLLSLKEHLAQLAVPLCDLSEQLGGPRLPPESFDDTDAAEIIGMLDEHVLLVLQVVESSGSSAAVGGSFLTEVPAVVETARSEARVVPPNSGELASSSDEDGDFAVNSSPRPVKVKSLQMAMLKKGIGGEKALSGGLKSSLKRAGKRRM